MRAITRRGWVEVTSGCMFAGKTEELVRRVRRAEIAGQDVAAFTPAVDDRYGRATIGSHTGRQIEATVVDPETPLADIREALNGHEVVAIDEANFLGPTLVETCEALAAEGRRVVVSGLDQAFCGEPFEPVPSFSRWRSISTSSGPSPRSVGSRRRATSGSSTATRPTTTTRPSWSGPTSPTRRAARSVTSPGRREKPAETTGIRTGSGGVNVPR